jgi:sugar phosphate isomerase/epimerase
MELGLTPDTRRKDDVAMLVEAARAAGFTKLGTTTALVTPETPVLYARAGLTCHELLGLVVTDVDTTLERATNLAAQAVVMGASWINTTFKVVDSETAALIRRCAAIFTDAGTGMAIEFSPLGPVASVEDGLEMVNLVEPYRVGLVVDIWNLCYGTTPWEQMKRLSSDRIAYIQFCDALPRTGTLEEEAMNRRAYPGEGVFDADRFVSSIRDIGWDGVVSIQILSEELRQLPIADFAQRSYETSRQFWLGDR